MKTSPLRPQPYGVALASVVLATLVRLLLNPVFGSRFPYPTFFVALMLNAWYGGLGPAALVMVLGAASANYCFIAPAHSLAIAGADNLMGLGIYLFVGLTSALLSESLHAAERRAEANAREAVDRQQALEQEILARQRAEETQRFLAEASQTLASSLDYQTTLDHLAKLVVPRLGDWCLVHLLARDGSRSPVIVASAHVNRESRELLADLLNRYPPCPDTPHGFPLVLRTGQPELLTQIPESTLAAVAVDDEHLRLLQALGLNSHVCVPMIARGEILGAISLVAAESGRTHTEADLRLAEELARRAATAIDNAHLYQESQTAQAVLQEQAAALVEADRQKDQFLAMLGHELRTPLSSIRNTLLVLQRQSTERPELAPLCLRIDRQVVRMARLIDDLQDVTRIAEGKLSLRCERFDLSRLVRDCAEDQRAVLEANHLTLTLALPAEPLWIEGDPMRLAQVLVNLLNNAAKFTDPAGQVHLLLAPQGGGARLTVRDTGIGIEPALLPHLFDSFTQAVRSLDRSRGGLGLGLALVKGLVGMHRGEVQITSAGLGCGTEVCLWLPGLSPVSQSAAWNGEQSAEVEGERGGRDE